MKHPGRLITDEITSKRMSNVKLKRGNEELLIAKELWHQGFRYRLNYRKLPGSPDIALIRYKIAIFIDGEFWHGYDWENKKNKLIRNREYWVEKIEENIARDKRVDKELNEIGWVSIRFWSKDVKKNLQECITIITDEIKKNSK